MKWGCDRGIDLNCVIKLARPASAQACPTLPASVCGRQTLFAFVVAVEDVVRDGYDVSRGRPKGRMFTGICCMGVPAC